MNIEFLSAIVIESNGADLIILQTNLPCPFIPAALPSQTPLDFEFKVSKGNGIEYVRNIFKIEPKIINRA